MDVAGNTAKRTTGVSPGQASDSILLTSKNQSGRDQKEGLSTQ